MAYAMLVHPSQPSPAAWVRKGGTALWEDWEDGASRNHIMFGDFACWAYQWLAGIRLSDGGSAATPDPKVCAFKEFLIAPDFIPQLNHVAASVISMYGRISVDWRRNGDKVHVNVMVPSNTKAVLRLPGVPDRKLSSGYHTLIVQGESCVARPKTGD